jgi:hypothetical protein
MLHVSGHEEAATTFHRITTVETPAVDDMLLSDSR